MWRRIRPLSLWLSLVFLPLLASAAQAQTQPEIDRAISLPKTRQGLEPDDSIAPVRLGISLLQRTGERGTTRDYRAAERAFERALERDPRAYAARVGLAFTKVAQHQFQSGVEQARIAIELDPHPADAYAAWFDASLGLGDRASATRAHQELATRADGPLLTSRSASLAYAEGDPERALHILEHTLRETAPHSGSSATSRRPAELAHLHLVAGEISMRHGYYERADRHFSTAFAEMPDSPVPLEHLGELRERQRRPREALALYRRALELSDAPELHDAISDVYAHLGDASRATRHAERALAGYQAAIRAGDVGYFRPLARFLGRVDRAPAAALVWAQRDLGLRQDAETWQTLAFAWERSGFMESARAALYQALYQGARSAELEVLAAELALRWGCPPRARVHLERALATNPRLDSIRRRLAEWPVRDALVRDPSTACPSYPRIPDPRAPHAEPSPLSRARAAHRTLQRIRYTERP